jgi:hypothetical protein
MISNTPPSVTLAGAVSNTPSIKTTAKIPDSDLPEVPRFEAQPRPLLLYMVSTPAWIARREEIWKQCLKNIGTRSARRQHDDEHRGWFDQPEDFAEEAQREKEYPRVTF